ncbi:MAG: thiol peroxidase [Pseudomonadota bacterium]
MNERKGIVTFQGKPLTLVGNEVKVGSNALDATLLDNNLNPVKLSSFRGKICVITTVPSLDTPVCDTEVRRFNQEAVKLDENVVVLAISADLPFAQARWCGAAGVNKVKTLSDHFDVSFGRAYAVLIKELRLLARSIFVLDKEGAVRYTQLVKEITNEPDYAAVLTEVKKLL